MLQDMHAAGGVYIQQSNFTLQDLMFTGNSANLGGSLFVAANLTNSAHLSRLTFANDDNAVRGVRLF